MESKYSTDQEVTPLEGQRKDPNSYFNHYKNLIALRNSYSALAIGSLELSKSAYPREIMAYHRKTAGQEIFVVHNLGGSDSVVEIPGGFNTALFTLGKGEIDSGKLTLGANSTVVLSK
jgi:alpha-amylase